MPEDDSTLQITTVVDTTQLEQLPAKGASAVNQFADNMTQGFAKAGQAGDTLQAKIQETSADLAQLTAAARVQAESLRDNYRALYEEAANGDDAVLESLGQQEAALAATKAQIAGVREELAGLIEQQQELSSVASLPVLGSVPAGETAAAGGSEAQGAATGADADAMTALATAENAAAEAANRLTVAQEGFTVAAEKANTIALTQAQALAVMGQQQAQVSAALAQSQGLQALAAQEAQRHAQAETQLAASTNAANEAAMLSAEAWQEAFAAKEEDVIATQGSTLALDENIAAQYSSANAVRSGISDRQAASASLRTLELNLQGSTRAAGTFLTQVLGLGPALQVAFPVIGAIALGEVLVTVGERVYTLYENIVNLKAEISALGEASEKTAKQAADANWKWIESQAEVLKSQGKIREAQELLAASSGEKPVSLSLGVDDKKLKDLPDDMQAFAQKLKEVHTQAQAESVFKELDTQMSTTKTRIQELEQQIPALTQQLEQSAAHPTGPGGGLAAGEGFELSHLQAQLTAATEYYNTLQNLRNTNTSNAATESTKVSDMDVSVFRRQTEEARQNLAAVKTIQDAKASLAEEEVRRELQLGEISQSQELTQIQQIETRKLSAIIQAQESVRSAIQAEASKTAAISENIAETALSQHKITLQQEQELVREAETEKLRTTQQLDAEITAEKLKQQQDVIKSQVASDQAELNELIRSIEVQVGATKTGSAQRVSLIESEVAVVGLFYNYQGEEYEKMLAKLAAADRERVAEVQRLATQELELRLKGIKEAADAEAQSTDRAIADQQRELNEINSIQQSQLRGAVQDDKRFGLPDIGKVQALYQQMQDAEQRYINGSILLAQSAADAKIQALQKVEQAAEIAALEDPANSAKFVQDAQEAANKIAGIEQDLQAKLKQLREQGAAEDQKIEQQLVQYKEQEEQKIASKMLQYEDQALFHSKSFGQAVQNIYRDLAESGINEILQLANRWIAEHVIMELATRLFHLHNTVAGAQADAQQLTQTVTTNVSTVTSEAAVAAAKAYAAYAEFPPVAAAMAAEAEASVLAFIPEASAEGGYDIPAGVDPILQAHAREMVLPEEHADTIRGLGDIVPHIATPGFSVPQLPDFAQALSRGEFSGQISNIHSESRSSDESGGDFHFHAGDVNANALDRTGVSEILRRHGSDVAKAAMKLYKQGHFSKR